MIVALYHSNDLIGYISQAEYEMSQNAFDNDSLKIDGAWMSDESPETADIFVICSDNGIATAYSGLVRNIDLDKSSRRISLTGRDFREMLDTDIQLEFLSSDSMYLDAIISKVFGLARSADVISRVSWSLSSLTSPMHIDTTSVFGDLRGTYQIVNAWSFLRAYLAYYQIYMHAAYSTSGEIIFTCIYHGQDSGQESDADISIDIDYFIHTQDAQALGVNHAVATISSDESPRPSLTEVHYWLYSDDTIHQTDTPGSDAMFPVRTKVCQAEYLAQAQVEAVLSLVEARYSFNVTIEDSDRFGPVDLAASSVILSKVAVYRDGVFQRLVPVSARITSFKNGLLRSKIKLGLKKAFLTDYIRS